MVLVVCEERLRLFEDGLGGQVDEGVRGVVLPDGGGAAPHHPFGQDGLLEEVLPAPVRAAVGVPRRSAVRADHLFILVVGVLPKQ